MALASTQSTVPLFSLSGYNFDVKDPQPEDEMTIPARLARLQSEFDAQGLRVAVEGVLLVHEHGHPHVLMLQISNAYYKLPGDYLRPGEDEIEGLKLRLNKKLAPTGQDQSAEGSFEIGELIGVWWRPNFENYTYPYLPAHITRPKEVKKMYLVHMPEKKMLSVPKNMKLLAVPLFELYENAGRYGPQLANLPLHLSRFNFFDTPAVSKMGKTMRVSTINPVKLAATPVPGSAIIKAPKSNIKVDPTLLQRSGLTKQELEELIEIFSLVDQDGGGTISRDELETLMRTVGIKTSQHEMDELMQELDKGTGEIDLESFVLTVTKKVQTSITSNELRHAFSVLQRYETANNPQGYIYMSSLVNAFTQHADHKMSLEEARELIAQVSSQSDKDTFNYTHFMQMCNLD